MPLQKARPARPDCAESCVPGVVSSRTVMGGPARRWPVVAAVHLPGQVQPLLQVRQPIYEHTHVAL